MFFSKYKKSKPKIRHTIADTRRIDEIVSGMSFEEIYSTVFSKLLILPGMDEIKIAEMDTLEKKSKKDLILLFFKNEVFIFLIIRKKFDVFEKYLISPKYF